MNGTNDCKAYINKLASIGTNYVPGKLYLSASARGYTNTNYYFDDANGPAGYALLGLEGVTSNGVPLSAVDYVPATGAHIVQGTNVAGYYTTGADGGQGGFYYESVQFTGSSGWYIIETVESFNGLRDNSGSQQGYFLQWFSQSAFGGLNYSYTPIGAVTHVDEPDFTGVENSAAYFGLWSSGKWFAICAWNARSTPEFQAVGDPFVRR